MGIRIKLSLGQKESVEWILSPQGEYWGSKCVKGAKPLHDSEGAESNNLVVPDNACRATNTMRTARQSG